MGDSVSQRLLHTPTRMEKIVKYYRVDKDGNKVEVTGPLTPVTPVQSNQRTSLTPARSINVTRTHTSRISQRTDANQISFTPIGMRYGNNTSNLNSRMNSNINTPQRLAPRQSYTENKFCTPGTPNAFKNTRGAMTYQKGYTRGVNLCPTSPIIPPLRNTGPIATPNRNYTLKTITNYNTGTDLNNTNQL